MKWQVLGNNMPALVCELEPGEKIFANKGSMIYMSATIAMTARARGGFKAAAARKALTGESFFLSEFQAKGARGAVAFAGHLPGRFIPFDLTGGKVLFGQKTAFLAAEDGVTLQTAMQPKIMAGVFGGEGLIIQRYRGDGMVFLEALGDILELTLAPREKMLIDTGKVVAWESTCKYDIALTGGVKTMALGGEGIFLASLEGPGRIFLQTMSLEELRQSLMLRQSK